MKGSFIIFVKRWIFLVVLEFIDASTFLTCLHCNLKVCNEGLLAFLAFLTVLLMSITGVNVAITPFAALQFCNLMCESTMLAQIYCSPILLCRPRSALCPNSLCCKRLLSAPHSSHFPTSSLLLLFFFSLFALHSNCFIPFSLLRCQKKQRLIPLYESASSSWQTFSDCFVIQFFSQYWTMLASLLGNNLPNVLPLRYHGN